MSRSSRRIPVPETISEVVELLAASSMDELTHLITNQLAAEDFDPEKISLLCEQGAMLMAGAVYRAAAAVVREYSPESKIPPDESFRELVTKERFVLLDEYECSE